MASSVEEILHAAYSFVRAREANRAISALTLDHMIQEQIDGIQGGDSRYLLSEGVQEVIGLRIPKLDALEQIGKDIEQLVAAVEEAGDDPGKLENLGFVVLSSNQQPLNTI
jgi:hypothetical protein